MNCDPGILNSNIPSQALNLFLRDVLTIFLEIAFSSLTLHYFIKFQKKKSEMLHQNVNVAKSKEEKRKAKKEKEDSKLTHMILYLTLLSITTHLGVCLCYSGLITKPSILVGNYLIIFAALSKLFEFCGLLFL